MRNKTGEGDLRLASVRLETEHDKCTKYVTDEVARNRREFKQRVCLSFGKYGDDVIVLDM